MIYMQVLWNGFPHFTHSHRAVYMFAFCCGHPVFLIFDLLRGGAVNMAPFTPSNFINQRSATVAHGNVRYSFKALLIHANLHWLIEHVHQDHMA